MSSVSAQSAEQKAAQLNDQGKDLWLKKKDLQGAAEKFRQATTLSPKPQYFFNLCYALHQLGHFKDARTACLAVSENGGDEEQNKKAQVVLNDIAKRIPDEPGDTGTGDTGTGDTGTGDTGTGDTGTGDTGTGDTGTGDTGTGDTGTGDTGTGDTGTGTTTDPGTVGDPANAGQSGPIPGLYEPAKNPDDYKWAWGVDVGVLGTNIANGDFGSSGGTIKLFIDFTGLRNLRAGLQLYANFANISGGDYDPLNVGDFGVGLFKHVALRDIYLTGLLGAHITALQSTQFDEFSTDTALYTLGARAEGTGTYLFGAQRNHALRASLAAGLYLPASNESVLAEPYGFDQGSVSLSLTFGYSMRFTTPFGRSSLITLE